MRVAVLSGKGGVGKTFIAANLTSVAKQATYIDCDVEEPNGRLFFKPQNIQTEAVTTRFPKFDPSACNGCRKCVDFCRFNALVFLKDKPMVFADICHSCGGCMLVCPTGAITEVDKNIGMVECGTRDSAHIITGILNLGEASGIPIIKAALSLSSQFESSGTDTLTIIDCPPGSACSVMECVQNADYCLIVAEPTAFGLHNFEMVYHLVHLLKKPCGIIINKAEGIYSPLDDFCAKHNINVLYRIPYSEHLASLGAHAEIAAKQDPKIKEKFSNLFLTIRREAVL